MNPQIINSDSSTTSPNRPVITNEDQMLSINTLITRGDPASLSPTFLYPARSTSLPALHLPSTQEDYLVMDYKPHSKFRLFCTQDIQPQQAEAMHESSPSPKSQPKNECPLHTNSYFLKPPLFLPNLDTGESVYDWDRLRLLQPPLSYLTIGESLYEGNA